MFYNCHTLFNPAKNHIDLYNFYFGDSIQLNYGKWHHIFIYKRPWIKNYNCGVLNENDELFLSYFVFCMYILYRKKKCFNKLVITLRNWFNGVLTTNLRIINPTLSDYREVTKMCSFDLEFQAKRLNTHRVSCY
jgi:hypothetical protein